MPTEREISLDLLLADPAAAIEVSTEQAAVLLGRLSRVQTALETRAQADGVTVGPGRVQHSSVPRAATWGPDDLLTIDEAAAVLRVSPRWLYRHAKTLPFARKLSRKMLRFSRAGISRWLATKRP